VTTRVAIVFMLAAPVGLSSAGSALTQQRPTFLARTDVVSVDVSVRNGNLPVLGLSATDFRLSDNGMPQTIEAAAIEAVPIDVTLFHDTSPSLAGRIEDLKSDVREIAAMLRPTDRFRLLTFDLQVNDVFGWRTTGGLLNLDRVRLGRISSIYDAIFVAMMHRPDVDRRHLIVALTDCEDGSSVVGSALVEEAARRAEGVLHIIKIGQRHADFRNIAMTVVSIPADARGERRLESAAIRTGGQFHAPFITSKKHAVTTFKMVFDDYRQSYVLRYTPRGVARDGWHEIKVEVPGHPRATIRARKGYFREEKPGT
jgi:VWFA-related protein